MPITVITKTYTLPKQKIQMIEDYAREINSFSCSEALRQILDQWESNHIPIIGTIDSTTGKIELDPNAKRLVVARHVNGDLEVDPTLAQE